MRLAEFLENLRNSCILFKFIDLYTIFRRDEALYNINTNKVKKNRRNSLIERTGNKYILNLGLQITIITVFELDYELPGSQSKK